MAHYRQLVDFELEATTEILEVLHEHLTSLDEACKTCADPDAMYWPDMEYLASMGFLVCQPYLSSVIRTKSRSSMLGLGPTDSTSGVTIARILDAAANYVKHHDEWRQEENWDTRVEARKNDKTVELLEHLGVFDRRFDKRNHYPMGNLLWQLTGDAGLMGLVPLIVQWRDLVFEEDLRLDEARRTGPHA